MMVGAAGIPFVAQADSAQAVATVYTASLLVTLPIVLAGIAALLLRRATAEGRVLVWRSALAALLVVFVGRQLPLHWPALMRSAGVAWVVPETLATPLVALGRVQVTAADSEAGSGVVNWILVAYVAGVLFVLARTIAASLRMRLIARRATPLASRRWRRSLRDVCGTLGIERSVRLVASREVAVPMTWGWLRPVVVIPVSDGEWTDAHRRIVLLHELAHVRAADWAFNLAARVACALYWFHPGAWWMARGLRDDCELACDDRVIASGVRRSDYAELLIGAAERFLAGEALEPALALSRRRGLRARLSAVLDVRHDVAPIARGWTVVAAASTLLVAGPMSAVRLAPTRSVLTTLMSDARWESRAYAVIRLASRADSVAVARTAAELDPSPRVRAWARYALGHEGQLPAVLHQ